MVKEKYKRYIILYKISLVFSVREKINYTLNLFILNLEFFLLFAKLFVFVDFSFLIINIFFAFAMKNTMNFQREKHFEELLIHSFDN